MQNSSEQSATFKANGNGFTPARVPQLQPLSGTNQPEEAWDLRRFLAIARRRALIIAGVTTVALSFSVQSALNQQTIYQGSFQLLVEPVNTENDLTKLTSERSSGSGQSGLDYDTQIAVLKSPELLSSVVKKVQSSYPDINYGTVIAGLEVLRAKGTKILVVRYQGDDPGKTQLVLDELSKAYLHYSLNQRQSYLRQGIQFVEKQLSSLQGDVNKLQNQLQRFRQQNGFLEPETQANKLTSQATALEQQQATIAQDLVQASSDLSNLQEKTGVMAALNASPGYQQVLSQIRQIDTEIAVERTRFKEQNLNIQVLRRKKDNLVPLLRQEAVRVLEAKVAEASARKQTLDTQNRSLVNARTKLNQKIQELPVLTQEYTNFQRELQIATTSLNRFMEIRQTLQVEAAQKEIPWQLIQEPALAGAQLSDTTKSLILAVLGSLAAGCAAAFLAEKLDSTYHTADDLRAKVKQPILGAIPFDQQLAVHINSNLPLRRQRRKKRKSLKQLTTSVLKFVSKVSRKMNFFPFLVDEYETASAFMEAFRVLHANLLMLNRVNRPVRSLVISSALPGDGKSTVALHWARTAVAMGHRVLLVDADLRRSQVHTQLNLDNSKGLSELIAQGLEPADVIQQVNPHEEFYVLAAGQPPLDPASLLSSSKTKQVMEKIHQDFDLVIYDAPPLLGLADANLLTNYVDGLVLVVGLAKTDRLSLQRVIEDLKGYQVPILGLVANGQRDGNSIVREYALLPASDANPLLDSN